MDVTSELVDEVQLDEVGEVECGGWAEAVGQLVVGEVGEGVGLGGL